jgi:hypothetical protein
VLLPCGTGRLVGVPERVRAVLLRS